jgi:hypothetical protein
VLEPVEALVGWLAVELMPVHKRLAAPWRSGGDGENG